MDLPETQQETQTEKRNLGTKQTELEKELSLLKQKDTCFTLTKLTEGAAVDVKVYFAIFLKDNIVTALKLLD